MDAQLCPGSVRVLKITETKEEAGGKPGQVDESHSEWIIFKGVGYYTVNINNDIIASVIQKAKARSSVEQRLAEIGHKPVSVLCNISSKIQESDGGNGNKDRKEEANSNTFFSGKENRTLRFT